MKIALIISGQPRYLSSPLSGKGIKEFILDRYDCDIYGFSWRSEKYVCSPWTNLGVIPGEIDPETRLKELYPGIKLMVEDSKQFPYDDPGLAGTASHLYSIEQVGKFFQQNANPNDYDFIILTRWDLNLIYFGNLSGREKGFYCLEGHPGIADQLFIFSPEYSNWMNLYSNYDALRLQSPHPSVEEWKRNQFYNLFPAHSIKRFPFELTLIRNEF